MSARGLDRRLATERVTSPTTLAAGSKAIYPGQGPCLIGRVVKKVVGGRIIMFYHLIVLDDSGGEVFIPVEKAQAIGVRMLTKRSEIPALLAHLKKSSKAADNWKQRATDIMKLFTSGSPFDLAEIIGSLTELGGTRSLTLGETGSLARARRLLISEIAEVTGETKTVTAEQVDHALKSTTRKKKTGKTTAGEPAASPPNK